MAYATVDMDVDRRIKRRRQHVVDGDHRGAVYGVPIKDEVEVSPDDVSTILSSALRCIGGAADAHSTAAMMLRSCSSADDIPGGSRHGGSPQGYRGVAEQQQDFLDYMVTDAAGGAQYGNGVDNSKLRINSTNSAGCLSNNTTGNKQYIPGAGNLCEHEQSYGFDNFTATTTGGGGGAMSGGSHSTAVEAVVNSIGFGGVLKDRSNCNANHCNVNERLHVADYRTADSGNVAVGKDSDILGMAFKCHNKERALPHSATTATGGGAATATGGGAATTTGGGTSDSNRNTKQSLLVLSENLRDSGTGTDTGSVLCGASQLPSVDSALANQLQVMCGTAPTATTAATSGSTPTTNNTTTGAGAGTGTSANAAGGGAAAGGGPMRQIQTKLEQDTTSSSTAHHELTHNSRSSAAVAAAACIVAAHTTPAPTRGAVHGRHTKTHHAVSQNHNMANDLHSNSGSTGRDLRHAGADTDMLDRHGENTYSSAHDNIYFMDTAGTPFIQSHHQQLSEQHSSARLDDHHHHQQSSRHVHVMGVDAAAGGSSGAAGGYFAAAINSSRSSAVESPLGRAVRDDTGAYWPHAVGGSAGVFRASPDQQSSLHMHAADRSSMHTTGTRSGHRSAFAAGTALNMSGHVNAVHEQQRDEAQQNIVHDSRGVRGLQSAINELLEGAGGSTSPAAALLEVLTGSSSGTLRGPLSPTLAPHHNQQQQQHRPQQHNDSHHHSGSVSGSTSIGSHLSDLVRVRSNSSRELEDSLECSPPHSPDCNGNRALSLPSALSSQMHEHHHQHHQHHHHHQQQQHLHSPSQPSPFYRGLLNNGGGDHQLHSGQHSSVMGDHNELHAAHGQRAHHMNGSSQDSTMQAMLSHSTNDPIDLHRRSSSGTSMHGHGRGLPTLIGDPAAEESRHHSNSAAHELLGCATTDLGGMSAAAAIVAAYSAQQQRATNNTTASTTTSAASDAGSCDLVHSPQSASQSHPAEHLHRSSGNSSAGHYHNHRQQQYTSSGHSPLVGSSHSDASLQGLQRHLQPQGNGSSGHLQHELTSMNHHLQSTRDHGHQQQSHNHIVNNQLSYRSTNNHQSAMTSSFVGPFGGPHAPPPPNGLLPSATAAQNRNSSSSMCTNHNGGSPPLHAVGNMSFNVHTRLAPLDGPSSPHGAMGCDAAAMRRQQVGGNGLLPMDAMMSMAHEHAHGFLNGLPNDCAQNLKRGRRKGRENYQLIQKLESLANEEGFEGEDGVFYKRPDVDDATIGVLCDITCLYRSERFSKLIVDFEDGISFPLGEGGRELLRACLNAKGCKGRQLQGASVPMLLQLARDWGLWNVAVRIKVERATGELSPNHEAFVKFKAMQSQLRKYLKREHMVTERDDSGKITDIHFEEMKYLTLGKDGREKLRAQLRRMHDKDPQRMDELLERSNFKYSELRNATVPQLLKMAHICGMWDEVVSACRQQEQKRDEKTVRRDFHFVGTTSTGPHHHVPAHSAAAHHLHHHPVPLQVMPAHHLPPAPKAGVPIGTSQSIRTSPVMHHSTVAGTNNDLMRRLTIDNTSGSSSVYHEEGVDIHNASLHISRNTGDVPPNNSRHALSKRHMSSNNTTGTTTGHNNNQPRQEHSAGTSGANLSSYYTPGYRLDLSEGTGELPVNDRYGLTANINRPFEDARQGMLRLSLEVESPFSHHAPPNVSAVDAHSQMLTGGMNIATGGRNYMMTGMNDNLRPNDHHSSDLHLLGVIAEVDGGGDYGAPHGGGGGHHSAQHQNLVVHSGGDMGGHHVHLQHHDHQDNALHHGALRHGSDPHDADESSQSAQQFYNSSYNSVFAVC